VRLLYWVLGAVLVLSWLYGVHELSGISQWPKESATTTTTAVECRAVWRVGNLTLLCMLGCDEGGLEYFGFNEELDPGRCWCLVNESWVRNVWC
jgi:hypothetical protein